MVEVFHQVCTQQVDMSIPLTEIESQENISIVEEGWTDDITPICSPTGDCLTILPGYYYWIFENSQYPCGSQGNHQFMVLDHENNFNTLKYLFSKYPEGAVGFWYLDEDERRVYYPNEYAAELLTANYFRNMFFRTGVSEEFAGGVTKKFRETEF